jgi:alpha-L-arabinofuranosidase
MRFKFRLRNVLALPFALVAAWTVIPACPAKADVSARLMVDASHPGPALPANFFGLMTEEINHAYDGGLFAELIQNRTFQDPGRGEDRVPIHWSVIGSGKVSTDRTNPVNAALPISLKLDLDGGEGGVANDGYWGIPVRPDTTYTANFYAKAVGGFAGPVTASLLLDDGDKTVAQGQTPPITKAWRKYAVRLKTGGAAPTTAQARFALSARGHGSVLFSFVSLFPPTYRNVSNGLRPDLMKLMAALRPKFIRLPGGNYVEGGRFADRFNWKRMIGPADQRPGHMGCWGYRSSDGFGLPQYLLWCQQLGAEPVLALFAGYVLNGDHVTAGSPEMAIYTQEALDEIEYVSGPASSKWGAKRAADGFSKPFPLHYVEIGNEDWFDRSGSYDGRFAQMARAIRARYPNLKIIATAPVRSVQPDLYDDHFYRSPRQLLEMSNLYDPRPASPLSFAGGGWNGRQPGGLRTFVGEWAAQEGRPTPDLNAALADAAFVMGLEKNSDAVSMECYAPLFVNVSPADPEKGYPRAWQWNTNLIGYDALRSFGSASYYAQVMLAQNKGDRVLPAQLRIAPSERKPEGAPHGGIGVGSWHTQVEYADLSVTGPDGHSLLAPGQIADPNAWSFTGAEWKPSDSGIALPQADAETWAITGDRNWTDYAVHLRARKLGGQEGFIVLWHAADGENYRWWNIGGWGNTLARCEAAEGGGRNAYGPGAPFKIETGRWYDLRLEVTGRRMRGYIDGKLVTDATYEPQPAAPPLCATATYDKSDRTVIVKVVNAGDEAANVSLDLRGVGGVEPNGTAFVLSGEPSAVNTVDDPMRVSPRKETILDASLSFSRVFPPRSFTILRLKTTK